MACKNEIPSDDFGRFYLRFSRNKHGFPVEPKEYGYC